MKQPRKLRWGVPVAVLGLALLGGTVGPRVMAEQPTNLPTITVEQLLTDVQRVNVPGVSGTIKQTSALGLPSIPGFTAGDTPVGMLLGGENTARVWFGPDGARVALQTRLGERNMIATRTDLWHWDAEAKTVDRWQSPDMSKIDPKRVPDEMRRKVAVPTPESLAQQALAAASRDAQVRLDTNTRVAGRAVYNLIVDPTSPETLVDKIQISVDGETKLPLQFQVFAAGQADPAFSIGFSDVRFGVPDASVYQFTPPPGAKLNERGKVQTPNWNPQEVERGAEQAKRQVQQAVRVAGSGWGKVAVTSVALPDLVKSNPQLGAVLAALPQVEGAWGKGRLLQTALVSALLTDDGRLLAGAVRPDALFRAAS